MKWKEYIKEEIKVSIVKKNRTATPDMQIKDIDGFLQAEVLKDVSNIEVLGSTTNKKSKITLKKGYVLKNGSDGILIIKPKLKEPTYVIASNDNIKMLVPLLKKLK